MRERADVLSLTRVAAAEIAGLDLTGRPFLHEQGQVVLRGFVRSLEIADGGWVFQAGDTEMLDKGAGTWTPQESVEEFHGPLDRTDFYRGPDDRFPDEGAAIQMTCHGMLFHIGLPLDDPWRDNRWPALDTDFLPADMR